MDAPVFHGQELGIDTAEPFHFVGPSESLLFLHALLEQIQLLAERGGESRRIDDGTAVSDESDLETVGVAEDRHVEAKAVTDGRHRVVLPDLSALQ